MPHANVLSTEAIGTIVTESGQPIATETQSGVQIPTADFSSFDTESVVIDRRGSGASPTYTTIYSGSCDFQSTGGTQYTNPAGSVDIADADLFIMPDSSGSLPAVKVGDRATVTQSGSSTVYNVVNTSLYTFPIKHLQLLLKRGPTEMRPRERR